MGFPKENPHWSQKMKVCSWFQLPFSLYSIQHCLHCSEVETMRKKTISLPTHSDMAILSKNAWQMLAKVIRVIVSHIANEGSG